MKVKYPHRGANEVTEHKDLVPEGRHPGKKRTRENSGEERKDWGKTAGR